MCLINGDMASTKDSMLSAGGVLLDCNEHICIIDNRRIHLTPTESGILSTLINRAGETVSAEDMFRALWKDEICVEVNNSISVHIRHLRMKMGDAEKRRYIKTVWRRGYVIEKT